MLDVPPKCFSMDVPIHHLHCYLFLIILQLGATMMLTGTSGVALDKKGTPSCLDFIEIKVLSHSTGIELGLLVIILPNFHADLVGRKGIYCRWDMTKGLYRCKQLNLKRREDTMAGFAVLEWCSKRNNDTL